MSDSATPWTAARQDSLSSLSPGVCTNSRPLSQWCYQHLILYFPLLILPSISPQLKAFPMSLLFQLGGQIIGASASASILPMNILGWAPLGLTGLISLLSKGLSRVFSSTTVQKHQFCGAQPSLWTSLVAQMVKNLPAMQETWVWSLGGDDTLEKGMATHSCILAWRIPWTEEPGGLQSVGSQRVSYDWAE